MKKKHHWQKAIALCVALAAIGCGEENGGPTAPTGVTPPTGPTTPTTPAVSGEYMGEISGWIEEQFIGTYPITVTVTQSGDRVTIRGTTEGGVIRIETTTGTVGTDGRFTPDDAEARDSETCGRRSEWEIDMVFSNGTVHWRESWQSEECGGSRFEATLTRTTT